MDEEIERRNVEFKRRQDDLIRVFESALKMYNASACPCAYPRYQQIIGIDCTKTHNLFMCFETELLIQMSSSNFNVSKLEKTDENIGEQRICKRCGSVYEYGWQDFSIAVSRQKLKITELKASPI